MPIVGYLRDLCGKTNVAWLHTRSSQNTSTTQHVHSTRSSGECEHHTHSAHNLTPCKNEQCNRNESSTERQLPKTLTFPSISHIRVSFTITSASVSASSTRILEMFHKLTVICTTRLTVSFTSLDFSGSPTFHGFRALYTSWQQINQLVLTPLLFLAFHLVCCFLCHGLGTPTGVTNFLPTFFTRNATDNQIPLT